MNLDAVDPELRALAELVPPRELTDPEAIRALQRDVPRPPVDASDLVVEERVAAGAPPVPVRVYSPCPRRDASVPAVLLVHGGGFFAGSVDGVHVDAVELARELGVVVVAVDYRLAPEHPFPAALDDCDTALRWIHDRAGELGVDVARVAVSGTSAGGTLAAALALRARDTGGPPICFQHLVSPALDDRLDTPSMHRFVDTPMWTRGAAATSWAWYLAGWTGEVPAFAAPARASDLTGLPPAYVSVAELDPLRDEGLAYAVRLLEAGVSVEVHSFPGTFHGSLLARNATISRRQTAETLAVWRRAFERQLPAGPRRIRSPGR